MTKSWNYLKPMKIDITTIYYSQIYVLKEYSNIAYIFFVIGDWFATESQLIGSLWTGRQGSPRNSRSSSQNPADSSRTRVRLPNSKPPTMVHQTQNYCGPSMAWCCQMTPNTRYTHCRLFIAQAVKHII